MEMFVEFKHGNSADPFATEDTFFPKLFNNTCANRGQIVLYSTRQQAYQFRTSIFTVGIFGNAARLFRWDRTGCQVTVPVDFSTDKGNRQLTEFFLRLDLMADDPEARGWDPTVEDATAEEVKDFSEAVKMVCEGRPEPERRRAGGRRKEVEGTKKVADPMLCRLVESVGDPSEYPRRKVSILDGKVRRDYIVGRPTSVLKAPTGRATRRIYEASDELESFFFVILYEAVHWVSHNKPERLNIKFIFDDVRVHDDGRQTGGLGKQDMYTMDADVILQNLKFYKSPPFTDLIRGLFRLFQSLAIANYDKKLGRDPQPQDAANVDKLKNCKAIIQLMKNAVERADWPEVCDKAAKDNYPRKGEVDKEDRVGLANLKVTTNTPEVPVPGVPAVGAPLPASAGTSRASKRGREEDDGYTTPTKRSKVEAV
ncbi:hypothetical protein BDM02DRAFT_3263846 [Thelephora ganbajun]|uniref:Uncharacterized protein n=1 Tax=Thelephora ganbajun TaxID=370292 RepID=A0ACB6Z307_THEGA|nr:hypothetical protein BDM02DRAFT_3263846 [Thelephora ganbajun]